MVEVGDKFVIVESSYLGDYWKKGNIVEFVKPHDNLEGVYEFKKPGSSDGYFLNFGIDGDAHFHSTVRPLRTEAEKRGAKFGVGGVEKDTGKRVVFNAVRDYPHMFTGEEVWVVIREDIPDSVTGADASNIRLDHEPEFVAWSEAPEHLRYDASRVYYDGEPVKWIAKLEGAFTDVVVVLEDGSMEFSEHELTVKL